MMKEKMLEIQAKTLGISNERVVELERIFNSELGIDEGK